jgi:ankyrin repeat protein
MNSSGSLEKYLYDAPVSVKRNSLNTEYEYSHISLRSKNILHPKKKILKTPSPVPIMPHIMSIVYVLVCVVVGLTLSSCGVLDSFEKIGDLTMKEQETQRNLSPLYNAMKGGGEREVQYCLDNGEDVNFMDDDGITLLMYTVGTPHNGMTSDRMFNYKYEQLLIDYGADVNKVGIDGYTALDCAILYGGVSRYQQILIDSGSIITEKTVDAIKKVMGLMDKSIHYTSLFDQTIARYVFSSAKEQGIELGLPEILESAVLGDEDKIKEQLKSISALNETEKTNLLSFTAAFGTADTMDLLLKSGLKIKKNYEVSHDNPFNVATIYGNIEMLKYFESHGHKIEKIAEKYWLINRAVEANQYEALEYLLNHGAKIIKGNKDLDYEGTFSIAAEYNRVDMMKLIIEKSSKPPTDNEIIKAIAGTCDYGQNEALEYLFDYSKGRNLKVENYLLDNICYDGYLDCGKTLVKNGLSIKGGLLSSPIVGAVYNGRIEILEWLIEEGADVNACEDYGNGDFGDPPIVTAVERGYLDIVQMLIANGAKINMVLEAAEYDNLLDFAKIQADAEVNFDSKSIYEYLKSIWPKEAE